MKSVLDYAVKHNYVLSAAQVGELARELFASMQVVTGINASYLRILIAGVQSELGTLRLRAAKGGMGKISDEDKAKQLAALESVEGQYYVAIVDAIITEDIADNSRLGKEERARRSLERNRRTNFARSAKSTVASYIKAGFDIKSISVTTITKRAMYEMVQATKQAEPVKPESVAKSLETAGSRVEEIAAQLCDMDAEAARQQIEKLLGHLTALLVKTGAKPTDKPADAFNRCVPLQTKAGIFWPAGASEAMQ